MKNLWLPGDKGEGMNWKIGTETHTAVPCWLSGEESACKAGDPGSIPGSGRSPGGGHGNPLHYSCLENPTDRGAWRATVHGVTESDTTEATERSHTRTHETDN